MTAPRIYMDPPEVKPYRFGLFGAAQPVAPDKHWIIGGAEWESLASYMASTYTAGAFALADQGGTRAAKVLSDTMPVGTAWPFAVYAGIDCGSIGRTPDDFMERSADVLQLAKQHACEAELWTGGGQQRVARLNMDFTGTSNKVLTGTQAAPTAVSLIRAVSLLEQWLGNNYNGVGMIHAPRDVAAYGSRHRQHHLDPNNGEALISPLGNRWVYGGGYDGTGPNAQARPAASQAWIYATGQVLIAEDDVIAPSSIAEILNRNTNREFAVAEQAFMLGVDGPWAAALVDLTLT